MSAELLGLRSFQLCKYRVSRPHKPQNKQARFEARWHLERKKANLSDLSTVFVNEQ